LRNISVYFCISLIQGFKRGAARPYLRGGRYAGR